MPSTPLKLIVITASVREGRFGPMVANWFLSRARLDERFETTTLDLVEVNLPWRLPATPEKLGTAEDRTPDMRAVYERLDAAEAFVVVTPEYNHGYPASIKHLVDWHYSTWNRKPVAFVSYGGMAGGLRAVEQLRQVFAEMHATTLRDSISFERYPEKFNKFGALRSPDEANQAADVLLERLSWWALTLRLGRAQSPYM